MVCIGWSLVVLPTLLRGVSAARGATWVPDRNAIGAEMLVRTAESCDVTAAWRLLNSTSFAAGWLTHEGTSGETPLFASARNGCGELTALIMLHPEFDDRTIRKKRLQKQLANHVSKTWAGKESKVTWVLVVIQGILTGMVSKKELEWNPAAAAEDGAWFLPEPGEWMPVMSFEEMGISRPAWPECNMTGLVRERDEARDIVISHDGTLAISAFLERLWFLLVVFSQSLPGTEHHAAAVRHIRSLGWHIFFKGSANALMAHVVFIGKIGRNVHGSPPEGDEAEGFDAEAYQTLDDALGRLWNKTGDWHIPWVP
mmetsp:Transcript_86242/g.249062  ORF Transcript_86242/g.249062 Transcript_86242/m.249062 type:complete len:313 (-) Transcript_86242:90-1028(-)